MTASKILRIHVGLPREVEYEGKRVSTGIFKNPVDHPVKVQRLNIDGDGQADLKVHGGELKAVYGYSAEHYPWWRKKLQMPQLEWGAFGENLTIGNWSEEEVYVGDRFAIADVELEAVQPRLPCFKLGIKFGDPSIIKKFMDSGRWGVYFRVIKEGTFQAGDAVLKIFENPEKITVKELYELKAGKLSDPEKIKRALKIPALPPSWRLALEKLKRK